MTSIFTNKIYTIAVLSALFIAALIPSFALAQAPTVQLSVNGGSSAAITNGNEVTLSWYIDGAVTNCSINNGVGAIDISTLPANDSMQVTPPDNASTDYTLTCNGGSSQVAVYAKPEITLTSSQGTSVSIDPLYGEVTPLTIEWSTRYATKCTKVWRELATNPGVKLWTADSDNSYKLQPNGSVSFTASNAQDSITETATFYIQCENEVTGTTDTQSLTVTVDNGTQPAPPTVDIWDREGTVTSPDAIVGWSYTSLAFAATDVTSCSLEAYMADDSVYPALPEGYGFGIAEDERTANESSNTFWQVRIPETTRFEVTCTQPNYFYDSVFYATSTASDSVTITVDPPVGDRSGVPAMTLELTVLESPFTVNPLTGIAQASVNVKVANAEYCTYSASSPSPYWGEAAGWWGQNGSGSKDLVVTANIPTTTTLYATCYRDYDLTYYAPGSPEYDSAEISTSTIVITVEDLAGPPAVETYIYGNAVWLDSGYLWNENVSRSGFSVNSGDSNGYPHIRTSTGGSGSSGSVTFPFVASYSASDEYDIHVVYCDENDGVNDYTITTESGYTYSWQSNSTATYDEWCNKWNTTVSTLVGSGVPLADGELITIECNSLSSVSKDEPCAIMGVGFGQGNNSSITVDVATSSGYATVPVLWMSENTEGCIDSLAYPPSGVGYDYAFTDEKFFYGTSDIATTTTFSVTCGRSSGEETTSTVDVLLNTGSEPVVATTSVATGDCTDPDTLETRKANLGERANPDTTMCEPAVDLVALSPALSYLSAIEDNVNGTYDGLDALILIQNFGEGDLPAGSDIAYPAVINFDQTYVDEFGVPAQISTPVAPGFNASITAPVMVDGVPTPPTQSPTLTKTFDGVPFGTHELCSRINLDGTVYPEWNIDYTNNMSCTTVTLPVPQPPININLSQGAIRSGQTVTIDWNLNVTYDMSCTLQGPGGVNETINAGSPPTNPYIGSVVTAPLTSTGKYEFKCTEPITGTVFTEAFTIEVIPEAEEV